jgi:dipeptidyl aminopeptidase/acylaminoacyl peptidase
MNMRYLFTFLISFFYLAASQAQLVMSPELLWSLGRVNGAFLYNDGNNLCYTVSTYDVSTGARRSFVYSLPLQAMKPALLSSKDKAASGPLLYKGNQVLFTTDGEWSSSAGGGTLPDLRDMENIVFGKSYNIVAFSKRVKVDTTISDLYPEYKNTTAKMYDDIMVRHWDQWEDGSYNHIFVGKIGIDGTVSSTDIMPGEKYHSPTMPFGGPEDIAWSPDEKTLAYVAVKKSGKEYAQSTNSDIYFYNVGTGRTTNFTEGMMGYDKNPSFTDDGKMIAWTSMATDGYESDKNDIYIADFQTGKKYNLTKNWDGTVSGFVWSRDFKTIYFTAAVGGAERIMELQIQNTNGNYTGTVRQITNDNVNYTLIGQAAGGALIANRTDFNHANEVYSVNVLTGKATALTHVNDPIYQGLSLGRVEKKMIETTDGKEMLIWVLYPPDFDPNKKYPTLLYCQGGPQSGLTQFFSYRWNLALMAANGYIVIAPNRRGMPGYGVAWNKEISGDWGGQSIRDYLSAVDAMKKEPYVDASRIGAVGASYGGYSVYMLAGVHENRFKTFIAHCGVFDMDAWYASTEELWFANYDLKGPYWEDPQPKAYTTFNPIKYINKWNTPILIFEGEKDYRIPYTQGLEAFQSARLKGIKSRFISFPDEGHWVTKPENSLVWHNEFFRWLRETL